MTSQRQAFARRLYRRAWPAILVLNGLAAGALLLFLVLGCSGLFIFLGTWPLIALASLAATLAWRPFLEENRHGKA